MPAELLLYLLESSICLVIVYGAYRLLLGRLSFHQGNRAVLVGGLLLCLLIPLFQWNVGWMPDWQSQATASVWKNDLSLFSEAEQAPPVEAFSPLPETIPAPTQTESPASQQELAFGWAQISLLLCIAWALGFLVHGWRLISSLRMVRRLSQQGRTMVYQGLKVVELPGEGQPFSHHRTIFLYARQNGTEREMILAHEAAHVRQAHSLDRLFCQIAAAILWFHPVMPRYRDSLIECHEFLADRAAVAESGPLPYARLLFGMALRTSRPGLVNHFAYSSTRKRISMIHTSSSPKSARLRYLLLAPLFACMLLLFACADTPEELSESNSTVLLGDLQIENPTFAGEAIPLHIPEVKASMDAALQKIMDKPGRFKQLLSKEVRWRPELEKALSENGLPDDFFYLAVAESELERLAKSSGGALGMWQFMPQTARDMGLVVSEETDDRLDVMLSTKAAADLLKSLKERFGSWTIATSAYNRGAGALQKDLDGGKVSTAEDLWSQPAASAYLIRIAAFKIAMENPMVMGIPADFQPFFEESGPSGSPLSPSVYRITSKFGSKEGRPFHKGVDLAAPTGTPVYATAEGRVLWAREDGDYGLRIVIQHGANYETVFAHLSKLHVKAGDMVMMGQLIGEVGTTGKSTGPHLHYEVRKEGKAVEPEGC